MQRTISESGNIIIICNDCSLGRCVPSARSGTAVLLSQGMAWLFRGFKQFVHSCHQQPALLFCQLLWLSVVAFMWISSAPLTVVVLFWASLFTWIWSHFTALCHCLSLYLLLWQINVLLSLLAAGGWRASRVFNEKMSVPLWFSLQCRVGGVGMNRPDGDETWSFGLSFLSLWITL